MKNICKWCKSEFQIPPKQIITNGICRTCITNITILHNGESEKHLDNLDGPVLLMQADPRLVVTANRQACELLSKDLGRIQGQRGGQVLDCIHAFSEAGCGIDENCAECKIKNAVVETFTTGACHTADTLLEIKKEGRVNTYSVQVSTEKIGDLALLRIDRYEEV